MLSFELRSIIHEKNRDILMFPVCICTYFTNEITFLKIDIPRKRKPITPTCKKFKTMRNIQQEVTSGAHSR